jgi:hypothetical protein
MSKKHDRNATRAALLAATGAPQAPASAPAPKAPRAPKAAPSPAPAPQAAATPPPAPAPTPAPPPSATRATTPSRLVFTIGQRSLPNPEHLGRMCAALDVAHVLDCRIMQPSRGMWSPATIASKVTGYRNLGTSGKVGRADVHACAPGRVLVLGFSKLLAEEPDRAKQLGAELAADGVEVIHVFTLKQNSTKVGDYIAVEQADAVKGLADYAASGTEECAGYWLDAWFPAAPATAAA